MNESATEHAAQAPTRGMLVYRASRLEALLEPLQTLLEALPPDGLLQPAELIAAHPGMRRWLLNQLARRSGGYGIAANLEIDLPGQWIDKLCRERLPELAAGGARYSAGALRFCLFELFDEVLAGSLDTPQLRHYLAEDRDGARRWHLGMLLGELFGNLLVYRPDWLTAWTRGHFALPEPGELAPLWRALRARIGLPHRSEQHAALLQAASAAGADAAPLHVFGISHLPPRHLEVLRALSRQRLVVLYYPDPCVEHWAGLGNQRSQLRALRDAAPGTDTRLLHLDIAHPLLASCGRLGQQFGALIAAAEDDIVVDVRHSLDGEASSAARGSLLGRLQDSIRRLDPALLALRPDDEARAIPDDASLQVHRCHSRLRELEVLRDGLLRALVELPGLKASEIAVLAPSMADYAPLLGAVFGPSGEVGTPLPYHVADLPLSTLHPLHAAWLALIAQARGRTTAPTLMALLRLPAVRRALELSEGDLDTLQHGLAESAAAMGLDAAARAAEGLPPLVEHTLSWGLDRLCASYVFGSEEDDPLLFDGLRPAGIIREGDAPALGAMHRILAAIQRLRHEAAVPSRASRWIELFRALWQALFRVDPGQTREIAADDAVHELLGELSAALRDARCDPNLSFEQALAMLEGSLSQVSPRGPFLHGGITFCGMVPQRALPFRVIAVLGLDEGAFPRRAHAAQIDPLPRHPRLGDRDVDSDDRYLFLETLMSARDRLHLSYVGEDARSGAPMNPSPVVSELLDLLDLHARAAPPVGAPSALCPWLIAHPLQSFDLRYQRAPKGPGLFTFGPLWRPAALPVATARPQAQLPGEPAAPIRLDALRRWLRNPAEELLRQRWRMRLSGLESSSLPADEPLDDVVDPRQRLWRRLLLEALRDGQPPAATPSPMLLAEGLLPPGQPGQAAYAAQQVIASTLYDIARSMPPLADGQRPVALSAMAGSATARIEGNLDTYRCNDELWLVEFCDDAKKVDALQRRLDLLLRFAVLALQDAPGVAAMQAALVSPSGRLAWSCQLHLTTAQIASRRGELQHIIDVLVGAYLSAADEPCGYFPATSTAVLRGKDPEEAWRGGEYARGERDWAPGYAWLLAGERRFWDADDPAAAVLADTARALEALLALPAQWSSDAGVPA